MAWHKFKHGESVRIELIKSEIEKHLMSGKVIDVPTKRIYLAQILNSGFNELAYSPIGDGWARTPLNPHCWTSPEGNRLA